MSVLSHRKLTEEEYQPALRGIHLANFPPLRARRFRDEKPIALGDPVMRYRLSVTRHSWRSDAESSFSSPESARQKRVLEGEDPRGAKKRAIRQTIRIALFLSGLPSRNAFRRFWRICRWFQLRHDRELAPTWQVSSPRTDRSDRGSLPCSTRPRSPAQTSPSSRLVHRLRRAPAIGSASRTAGRLEWRST